VNSDELCLVLIALGSWSATQLYKLVFPRKPVDPQVVNVLVSAGIGAGVAMLAEGEPLGRVLVGAAAAILSAAAAAGVHRIGDALRAYKEAQLPAPPWS